MEKNYPRGVLYYIRFKMDQKGCKMGQKGQKIYDKGTKNRVFGPKLPAF